MSCMTFPNQWLGHSCSSHFPQTLQGKSSFFVNFAFFVFRRNDSGWWNVSLFLPFAYLLFRKALLFLSFTLWDYVKKKCYWNYNEKLCLSKPDWWWMLPKRSECRWWSDWIPWSLKKGTQQEVKLMNSFGAIFWLNCLQEEVHLFVDAQYGVANAWSLEGPV